MRISILKKAVVMLLCGGFIFTASCSEKQEDNATMSETSTAAGAMSETTAPRNYDKVCALTFDDGPNNDTTPLVLDKLEKYGVKASFFLIGQNINSTTEDVVKRAYDMGCEINNHSKTHSDMTKMSGDDIAAEIKVTNEKIEKITGEQPHFFRPPYIAANDTMFEYIDLPFIAGYGANDWEDSVSADERAEKIIAQAKDGYIILLHDMNGNSKTVEALDTIIPTLLDEGYEFVTVSELFEKKNIEPADRIIYSYAEQTNMYA